MAKSRYAVYGAIASGGMATVHYGRVLGDAGFSRVVAIKKLHPHFAIDPEFSAMLLDEGRMAARIRHPNVVATIDVVHEENDLFLVMEYVPGESLSRLMRTASQNKMPVPIGVAAAVASAMSTACTRRTRPPTRAARRSGSCIAMCLRKTCSSEPTACRASSISVSPKRVGARR